MINLELRNTNTQTRIRFLFVFNENDAERVWWGETVKELDGGEEIE